MGSTSHLHNHFIAKRFVQLTSTIFGTINCSINLAMSSNGHTNKWWLRWRVATPQCMFCGWFSRSAAFNPESRIQVLQTTEDDGVWTAGNDGLRMSQTGAGRTRMSQIGAGGSRMSPLETNVKLCATYG
jgi:hypothetical protein